MSTYIDPVHPSNHTPYLDIPEPVQDYLHYLDFIKHLSPRTINAYYIDLRLFFRYLLAFRNGLDLTDISGVHVNALDLEFVRSIRKAEIYNFLEYQQSNKQNGPTARKRKLSSIKGFFHYLLVSVNKIDHDPCQDISLGAPRKSLPKYLTLEEATELLKNIQSDFYERDFCILTMFLNCGMRLTELVTIDLSDFRNETIKIIGKGDKERLVYLNDACKDALEHYLTARASLPNLVDRNALLVSKKTGKRLSPRRVEQIVSRCLQSAGLSGRGYSPHKLRHTAATLMYQYGDVDMLALKEILGHANVSTTQIYTHINQKKLRDAVDASPLAKLSYEAPPPPSEPQESSEDEGEQNG